jgi:hypothetical protein
MPTPREHLGAASDGRYVYAVGGRQLSAAKNLGALEPYDPASDGWKKLAANGSWTGLRPSSTLADPFAGLPPSARIRAGHRERPMRGATGKRTGWPGGASDPSRVLDRVRRQRERRKLRAAGGRGVSALEQVHALLRVHAGAPAGRPTEARGA